MENILTGYELGERIYSGSRSIVHRARRRSDGARVVVKIQRAEHPDLEELARFRREAELLGGLSSVDGVVHSLGLAQYKSRLALLMEDSNAQSLRSLMTARWLDIGESLEIALQLARALAAIHRRHIIHKDINPSNVVVQQGTGRLEIIDFGIATALSREEPSIRSPEVLEGTLRYISPEQTGRMNRSVDHRTDFYSLGVTLYELLVGVPPFQSGDAMELVHCHIARQPVPPHVLRPEVPPALSALVLKLLAKNAEERYQSGHGLAEELSECLAQWRAAGRIEALTPGRHDVSDRFHIPQKLYGREAERDLLLTAFERAHGGRAELVLVAGYPGAGKSALVNELHMPIVERRGYFISGKFHQLKRNAPYASLVEAFDDLIRQLLTEPEGRLAEWRRKLEEALGQSAPVMAEMIPAVALLLGPQPPAPVLPPTESQYRFNFAFQRFVHAFATQEHPLAVFLDDLQWADPASLKLLQLLLAEEGLRHLCIIGAYRDNEVTAAHPLLACLGAIREKGTTVTTLGLEPLGQGHVAALVSDTLKCGSEAAGPLAALLRQKTDGNPFFLVQMLEELHREGLVGFDAERRSWRWELDAIRGRGLTGDVVELMGARIQKLSAPAQRSLQLAACIGGQFDLRTLSLVDTRPPAELAGSLWEALEAGLLLPHGALHGRSELELLAAQGVPARLRFLHDRVQQAAYSHVPRAQREELHLELGRLLLAGTPSEAMDERIFDIVNQFELALERISLVEERYAIARLSLQAGRKAKLSAAWEPALRYLTMGHRLLPGDAFHERHSLAFELYTELAEAEYLNGMFDRAEVLTQHAMGEARSTSQKVRVLQIRMLFYTARNQLQDTVTTGLEALALLGVSLPATVGEREIGEALARARSAIAGRSTAELGALPELTDPDRLAALRILIGLVAPAYVVNPPLFVLIVGGMVELCARHGNSVFSPVSYAMYSSLQSGALDDLDAARAYADLALELLDRWNAWEFKGFVYLVVNIFVRPWKTHLQETLEPLREGVRSAMEAGDIEHAGYCFLNLAAASIWAGKPLQTAAAEQASAYEFLTQLKLEFHRLYIRVTRQVVHNLLGRAEDPCRLVGESFDERTELPALLAAKLVGTSVVLYVLRSMLALVFGDFALAAADCERAEPLLPGQQGQMPVALHAFHQSLALLALLPGASEAERRVSLEKVERNVSRLRRWAEHAPMNFLHKLELVEAERARALDRPVEAMERYERAIRLAAEHQYPQDEALACERCADFCFARGWARTGETFLVEAHYAYERWGAVAKVAQLEKRHPTVLASSSEPKLIPSETPTTSRRVGGSLELSSVMKAARAISGEIVLERLLETLMRIMLENAGAQRGVFLLDRGGELVIEAEWSIGREEVRTRRSAPLTAEAHLPASIIQYAARTGESVVLRNATMEGLFTKDPYVVRERPRSVLCAPLLDRGERIAIIYLENNLAEGAFTADRLEVLRLLSAQAALSLHNAHLYATLEQKVQERTGELSQRNRDLAAALEQLRDTQQQLVMREKLASLGAMTAGIAHELKNPLNFVNNFAVLSVELASELEDGLRSLHGQGGAPGALESLAGTLAELKENISKIGKHGRQANTVINSMLLHARSAPGEREEAELNALVARSISLACDGMRGKTGELEFTIQTEYDESVGKIDLAAQALNQAFVNIIANACYAMREKRRSSGPGYVPTLVVRTRGLGERVEVRFRDNGHGIPPEIAAKIFNPFFTTKPPGEGTGLGLSISHDIVVRGHSGQLRMETAPGEFTEFIITLPRKSVRG